MEKRLRTFTNVSQKNRKTLGVRWPKRHGVTAPLDVEAKTLYVLMTAGVGISVE